MLPAIISIYQTVCTIAQNPKTCSLDLLVQLELAFLVVHTNKRFCRRRRRMLTDHTFDFSIAFGMIPTFVIITTKSVGKFDL